MTVLSLKGARYSGDGYWVGRLLVIVCLLLAAPASALAAPVTLRDGVLSYAPTDVQSSTYLFYGSDYYAVVDGANSEPGEGCVRFMSAIRCDHNGAQAAIVLRFGPHDDFGLMRDLTGYVRSSVHGGDGTDRLELGRGPDLAHGGPGHDTLDGGEGDDDLRGDEGADRLVGGAGADRLDGGPGVDQVDYYYEFGRSGDNGERPGGVQVTVGSVRCPSLPMPQHKCAGRIVLTTNGKRLGRTRFNLANGATARYRIRLRHPVGKLRATVESGPNALSRTTLAVSR